MYGLVNRAIEQPLVSVLETGTWQDIKQRAGVNTTKFLNTEPFPDETTYRLVKLPFALIMLCVAEWIEITMSSDCTFRTWVDAG